MKALPALGQFRGYFSDPLITSSQIVNGSSESSPKGSLPHIISQSMTPNDHKSTWKLYPFPRMISGAMQCGVPMMVLVRYLRSILSLLAVPMSTRVRYPSVLTIRFSGFKSRQMMRLACRCSISNRIWLAMNLAFLSLKMLILLMASNMSSPAMKSITKQMKLASLISLQKFTRKGCLGAVRRISSSFMMYWIKWSFSTVALSNTLMAYSFYVSGLQQAQTCPKLPPRSSRIIQKSEIAILFSIFVISWFQSSSGSFSSCFSLALGLTNLNSSPSLSAVKSSLKTSSPPSITL